MYTNGKGARQKKKAIRLFKSIALAPGKMPRITGEKSDRIMGICEAVALIFTAALMLHLIVPEVVGLLAVVISGVAFGFLLFLLLLGSYQDKLVEYELYGFRL